MRVAGQSVGHVSTVACAISLGEGIIVAGTCASRTHASQTTSSSTTVTSVGIRRLNILINVPRVFRTWFPTIVHLAFCAEVGAHAADGEKPVR